MIMESLNNGRKKSVSDRSVEDPSAMSTVLRHALVGFELGEVEKTPVAVAERIKGYFEQCEIDGVLPTVIGLANYFCINKTTLWKWKHGEGCNKEIMGLVQIAHQVIEETMLNAANQGQVFAPMAMFYLKCSHNYNDQPKIEVESKQTVVNEITMKDVLELADTNKKDISYVEAEDE